VAGSNRVFRLFLSGSGHGFSDVGIRRRSCEGELASTERLAGTLNKLDFYQFNNKNLKYSLILKTFKF